jgi:hypothetical protein
MLHVLSLLSFDVSRVREGLSLTGADLEVIVGLEAAVTVGLEPALLFEGADVLAWVSGTCSCSERDQTSASKTLELRPVEANVKLSSKARCTNLQIGVNKYKMNKFSTINECWLSKKQKQKTRRSKGRRYHRRLGAGQSSESIFSLSASEFDEGETPVPSSIKTGEIEAVASGFFKLSSALRLQTKLELLNL